MIVAATSAFLMVQIIKQQGVTVGKSQSLAKL